MFAKSESDSMSIRCKEVCCFQREVSVDARARGDLCGIIFTELKGAALAVEVKW